MKITAFSSLFLPSINTLATASDGIRQSPRGESDTVPTFTPSGEHERLNCPDKSGDILQKTEDIVGPYILHDFFLYYVLRYGYSPEKIKFIAVKSFCGVYDEDTIEKWLRS